MLAHNLKDILTLIPEARELVKLASVEEEFPTDNSDSASASYLRVHYLMKVANKPVDEVTFNLVKTAAELYGVKNKLDKLLPRLDQIEKKAVAIEKYNKPNIKIVEAGFEGDLAGFGFLGIEKIASTAEEIVNNYGEEVTSTEVLRYSGRCWLNKEAAIQSIANRVSAIPNQSDKVPFVKVARLIVESVKENDFPVIGEICKTVTLLDKKAGLDIIGFNFYKEALITKEAAVGGLTVSLAGEQVPYTKIVRFGKDRIGSSLGNDIASSLIDDPVNDKAVLESLPRDLQIMLASLVKSC